MNSQRLHSHKTTSRFAALVAVSACAALLSTGCKSRFFSFGEESAMTPNQPPVSEDSQARQVAIAQQNNSGSSAQPKTGNAETATAPYIPVKGSEKKLALGSTQSFEVNGQQVEITFESVLEDSRCPKNVVCIWEGQAKLQFMIKVPALNLTKRVTPTLRSGHPQLGQVIVGSMAFDLVGLMPDSPALNQKAGSPEATLVVGKAP